MFTAVQTEGCHRPSWARVSPSSVHRLLCIPRQLRSAFTPGSSTKRPPPRARRCGFGQLNSTLLLCFRQTSADAHGCTWAKIAVGLIPRAATASHFGFCRTPSCFPRPLTWRSFGVQNVLKTVQTALKLECWTIPFAFSSLRRHLPSDLLCADMSVSVRLWLVALRHRTEVSPVYEKPAVHFWKKKNEHDFYFEELVL